jgi:YHS domain-containing protein
MATIHMTEAEVAANFADVLRKVRKARRSSSSTITSLSQCCVPQSRSHASYLKSRKDIDPVSGNQVDKATAAVGIDKEGNVFFFENPENLKKFRIPSKAAE